MLFALLALADAPAQAYPNPLTPAGRGQIQCYAPTARKTCASMSAFTANGDGTFANANTIMMSKKPVVVIRMTTPVTIKGDAVCGTVRGHDITAGTLDVDGQAVPADQAAVLLAKVAASAGGIVGHEICTTFVGDGSGFTARATMDGTPQPDQNQQVIWVTPDDGYTVAP